MNRIPPKGTVGHRRYYRDKVQLAEMKAMTANLSMCKMQAPEGSPQRTHFANALMLVNQAIAEFDAGWQQEYIHETAPPLRVTR